MNSDEKLDKILEQVEKINRGVYGDKDNGVKGLIKENQDQEERIKSLEDTRKHAKYWVGGVTVAGSAVVVFVKEKLLKL